MWVTSVLTTGFNDPRGNQLGYYTRTRDPCGDEGIAEGTHALGPRIYLTNSGRRLRGDHRGSRRTADALILAVRGGAPASIVARKYTRSERATDRVQLSYLRIREDHEFDSRTCTVHSVRSPSRRTPVSFR